MLNILLSILMSIVALYNAAWATYYITKSLDTYDLDVPLTHKIVLKRLGFGLWLVSIIALSIMSIYILACPII